MDLCYVQGSWKIQLRQRLSNLRQPAPGQKRDRDESDKENQPTQPKPKRSSVRVGSVVDTQLADQESYDENVCKLSAELELEKPNRKTVRRLMKVTFPQRRAWITEEDAPTVPAIIEQFPCLKGSKYVSTL